MKQAEQILKMAESLNRGLSVLQASEEVGISYSTGCARLRKANLDNKGKLKDSSKLLYSAEFKVYLAILVEKSKNLAEIAETLGVSRDRLSSILATAKIKVRWHHENNHDPILAAGRKAELFVKSLGIPIVRDSTSAKNGSTSSPFDLILQGYGSVDVKHTIIRYSSAGKPYASFSVANFTKGVKYAFLVLFDESRTIPKIVFAVPGKNVYGHSTISISLEPISKKYKEKIIWKADEESKIQL